jgi:hypothetical protein
VETNAEAGDLAARERAIDVHSEGLGSVEGVGSAELQSEGVVTAPREVEQALTQQPPVGHARQPKAPQPAVSEIKQMLAGLMAMMQLNQENNVKMLDSVRADLGSVKSEIQNSVKAELAANQESLKVEICKMKKGIQKKNQQLRIQFTGKLDSEAKRVSNLDNKVQKDTESELVAVRRQLQAINSQCEAKVIEASNVIQNLVQELANHFEEHRTEVDNSIQKLGDEIRQKLTQQKENLDQVTIQEKTAFSRELSQVNAKLVALENRVLDLPTTAVVIEPYNNNNNQNHGSPSTGQQSDSVNNHVQSGESRTCSCENENCNVCMDNRCRMVVSTEAHQVSSFLSSSELPLPLFNENKDTNPVYHLRQLDQFLKFRGVPKAMQLAVAYRSIVGPMSSQWLETVSWNLQDYTEFKEVFLKTWWSTARQNLVKCRLYRGNYDRNSGLSLSGYFLKQATIASYLDPKPTEIEITEALRSHYPIGIQRAMLSTQSRSIEETLDLLKRVEVMEESENYQKPHYQPPHKNQNNARQNRNNPHDRRHQTQGQVRHVHYGNHNNNRYQNENNRNRNRNQNYGNRRRNENQERHLPPSTPTLHPSQAIDRLWSIRKTNRRDYSRPDGSLS